jgi:predicted nucleotidyltransferase
MSSKLIAAYIFGSVARSEQDELSDLDVLAVVQTGGGKVDEAVVAQFVPPALRGLKLSISWYGQERLREMFENGELFAWHLADETQPIFDPSGFLAKLGRPGFYCDAAQDVASFLRVFSGIREQIMAGPHNAAYEAGLVYVCLRNIAMAASSRLCGRPDFSRYSAFRLHGLAPCPITPAQFDIAMRSRMASQRGYTPPPEATAGFVLDLIDRLGTWLTTLQTNLEEMPNGRAVASQSI